MMRLKFAMLSAPSQKMVGHWGTGGTASSHAAFLCPTMTRNTGDAVGHTPVPAIQMQVEWLKMSHPSHSGQNKVGHCKPSIHAAVPSVPPVPPKKHSNEIDREAFEERAAIMEFDGGMSRAEAERQAFTLQHN